MTHSFAATLIALVAMGRLAVPVHADVVNISGTISGDATLTPTGTPGVYVQNFSGDGDDTTFGSFTPASTSTRRFQQTAEHPDFRWDAYGDVCQREAVWYQFR
jgi:hypothetical protein